MRHRQQFTRVWVKHPSLTQFARDAAGRHQLFPVRAPRQCQGSPGHVWEAPNQPAGGRIPEGDFPQSTGREFPAIRRKFERRDGHRPGILCRGRFVPTHGNDLHQRRIRVIAIKRCPLPDPAPHQLNLSGPERSGLLRHPSVGFLRAEQLKN